LVNFKISLKKLDMMMALISSQLISFNNQNNNNNQTIGCAGVLLKP